MKAGRNHRQLLEELEARELLAGRPWWRTAACRRSGRLQISQKSLIPKGILQRL